MLTMQEQYTLTVGSGLMNQNEYNSVQSGASELWNACGYLRLSHEDGDKEESNSITGQKNLIRDYFSHHPEIVECGMRVDDGFSGSSFVEVR